MTTLTCDYVCTDHAPKTDILRGAGLAVSLAVIFLLPVGLAILAALQL